MSPSGAEGTVFSDVNSALYQAGCAVPTYNFIGGLGGADITLDRVRDVFATLSNPDKEGVDGALPFWE